MAAIAGGRPLLGGCAMPYASPPAWNGGSIPGEMAAIAGGRPLLSGCAMPYASPPAWKGWSIPGEMAAIAGGRPLLGGCAMPYASLAAASAWATASGMLVVVGALCTSPDVPGSDCIPPKASATDTEAGSLDARVWRCAHCWRRATSPIILERISGSCAGMTCADGDKGGRGWG